MDNDQHAPCAEGNPNKATQSEVAPDPLQEPDQELAHKHQHDQNPSGFAAKYAQYAQFLEDNPNFDPAAEAERRMRARQESTIKRRQGKEIYFFYGTLMDPSILQSVLGLTEAPVLTPAILYQRGHMRMWGPFPAFLEGGSPLVDVRGMACEVEGEEAKERLEAYEGANYWPMQCLIDYIDADCGDDGTSSGVKAKTFKWVGDEDELEDGSFNLEAYKLAKAKLLEDEK